MGYTNYNSFDGFMVALFCFAILAVTVSVSMSIAAANIQGQCDKFGKTSFAGTVYTCAKLERSESR